MKNNNLVIILILATLFSLNGCVAIAYHDYAENNFDQAAKYILQLKNDTILIVLPMYQEEEDIYKSAIRNGVKDIEKNKRLLSQLRNKRIYRALNIIEAFEESFNFAKALYIPDSLVHTFERGEERAFFLNKNGVLDSSITYNNRSPIKIIQPSDVTWNVVIGNKILPNPFPNNASYKSGLSEFLALPRFGKITGNIAETFQLRFEKYYADPSSRLYH